MTNLNHFSPSDRTTFKRKPQRGSYDRDVVYAILDEAFLCHVGFVRDQTPFVIPMAYARIGDILYLHGSHASRLADVARTCQEICVTVTLLDGLVLARSALHHSMNYRSVMIVGPCALVKENEEKLLAMESLVEHILPGRMDDCHPPDDSEIRRTAIISPPIHEASAKIRSGPPPPMMPKQISFFPFGLERCHSPCFPEYRFQIKQEAIYLTVPICTTRN